MRRMLRRVTVLLAAVAAGTFALKCATTGINKGDINLISVEQEIAMGRQFSQEIAKTYPLLDDPEVTRYFQRLGEKIARNSDWPDLEYHFQIVNTADVNAFAIPGGWIYIHRGLIERAGSLSEVACVISHEIGHVVARHGTEMLTKQYGIALLTQLILGRNPKLWQKITTELFTTAGILAYSRKHEFEADELGVRYAFLSGYDPNGMVSFFEKLLKLEKSEPSLIEVWFSTHPPTQDRIRRARANIARLPDRADLIEDEPDFHRIQQRLKRSPKARTLRQIEEEKQKK